MAVGPCPAVIPADRAGVPDWKVDEQFKNDVFTFVRVEYDSVRTAAAGGGWGGYGWGWGGWATDFPDSDLNFSLPPPAAHVAQGQSRARSRCG